MGAQWKIQGKLYFPCEFQLEWYFWKLNCDWEGDGNEGFGRESRRGRCRKIYSRDDGEVMVAETSVDRGADTLVKGDVMRG